MDFNINLTVKPEDQVVTNNHILVKKRLLKKINLHNYKVAYIDFSSNFKNENLINITSLCLKTLNFSIIKPINVPFSTTEDAAVI